MLISTRMSDTQSNLKLGTFILEFTYPTKMVVISFFECFMSECFYLPSKLEFIRSNQGALLLRFAFERTPYTFSRYKLGRKI